MALYQYIPPHLAIHQAPLLALCLAKSSKSSISAQEVKTSIWNCPPSTTVSCTMDTWQLASYPFSSRSSTMPTTAFLSPKLNERKQRRLRWVVQTSEYFQSFFLPTKPILRWYPASLARRDLIHSPPAKETLNSWTAKSVPVGTKNSVPVGFYSRNSAENNLNHKHNNPQTLPQWWCRSPLIRSGIYRPARSDAHNLFQRGRAGGVVEADNLNR
jgi:hypothetical protein